MSVPNENGAPLTTLGLSERATTCRAVSSLAFDVLLRRLAFIDIAPDSFAARWD